ncbi:hypothetical protein M408DRAFT_328061 [Serendipita vermifera MAFF 305830]|uniref:Uncharacterized protein n=1 Tax=Serendipita vermifera MAFF 305830 TaxID=933852 RepID=A0A0C2WWG7_SERVB|nr:hypothetical protein M408DRAFT_328061 [Serendipita vermifera MAFF 305830]
MEAWNPDPAGLAQILQTLRDSTNIHDKQIQQQITMRLNEYQRVPNYIAYLAHILSSMTMEGEQIRSIAGYILKNNSRLITSATPDAAAYVKAAALNAFADQSLMLRNAAQQVIIAILGVLEPRNWPEALSMLIQALDSPDPISQEGAFVVLSRACEDYPRKFDVEIQGSRPLDFLIPKWIKLCQHPSAKIRGYAISCLTQFVPIDSEALNVHIDSIIASFFRTAADTDAVVRRNVCTGLVLLLASRPDKLVPEMHNVAEYMLYSTQDQNALVSLEACEFWLTFAEDPDLAGALTPYIPRVAPVLLDSMVYSPEDLMWLEGDAEDDHAVPDREEDIKPRHYGGRAHGLEKDNTPGGGGDANGQASGGGEGDEEEEEEEDYDDDEDMSTEWNLRKCAAAALDVLAVRFNNGLLQPLLPHLKEKLWSPDWKQRECGILALGALAEGCIDYMEPHLPTLIPFLVNMLGDTKPLVRSITCWTLGRYAGWYSQPQSEEQRTTFFVPIMEGLLRMVLDNNKRVQEAGCSAFATFEEEAGPILNPYLEPILQNLVLAFDKYQQKNLLILYDAVGTLADAVGSGMQNPALLQILMRPLEAKWSKLGDDDEDLVPLLECLTSVTIAAGPAFGNWAPVVYERCYRIIHTSLVQYSTWQQNQELDEPDRSFIIVALDLLSGLVQGLGGQLAPSMDISSPHLLTLVVACLKHPQASVRQSGYALIGDLAMSCFDLLRPHLPSIMPELINQLDPAPKAEFVSASNNAAWSAGEIALHYGKDPDFQQWVPQLILRLIPILLNPQSPKSLSENAAVTIGRIGLVQPEAVAPHLESFAVAWCQALVDIKDNEEKDSAFRGFCTLIQANPTGITRDLMWFCHAVVRWQNPSAELNDMFSKILQAFRQMAGPQWENQMLSFGPTIAERLRTRYNV